MSDEGFFLGFCAFAMLVFFGFIGVLAYGEYSQSMACIERGGMPVNRICLSRASILPAE